MPMCLRIIKPAHIYIYTEKTMRYTLMSSLFLAQLASAGAFAAEQHNHSQGMKHEAMQQIASTATKAMPLNDGAVIKVDGQNGKITLQHGDIANVMPAMTMSYRVKKTLQLESIHAGDKVRFALDKLNGEFVVVQIEAVR